MDDYTAEEFEQLVADAARYRYLRDNNLYLKECLIERRGIRGTMANSPRETWYEHEGWLVSDMSITTEPYESMEAAIDAGMQAKLLSLLNAEDK